MKPENPLPVYDRMIAIHRRQSLRGTCPDQDFENIDEMLEYWTLDLLKQMQAKNLTNYLYNELV